MTASELMYLLDIFEITAAEFKTVAGAMIRAFGFEYDKNPMYRELEQYITKTMYYDEQVGEWLDR